MKIFNGKKEADKILLDLKKKIRKKKKRPKLAIIVIGENPASNLYIKLKKEAGEKIGIKVIENKFQKNAKELEIIQKIKDFNQDESINGIIVQLPLPSGFKTEKIIQAISLKKDVDGFHKLNRKLLKKGNPYFFPVLPLAILTALKKSGGDLKNKPRTRTSYENNLYASELASVRGKKILALVNSNVFGEVLKDFFEINDLKIQYNLVDKNNIRDVVKKADVLITVFNKPNFIKSPMIKKGAVLIDAGFIKKNKKAIGNIDKESVKEKAGWLSPVPGGIGPLTVALLLRNVFLASQR